MKMVEADRFFPSWLREPEPQKIATLLGEGNCKFVGGAVRDSLLELAVSDVDIATPLLPEEAAGRLEEGGVKVIPTGLKHGTITAIISGRQFEITTLRHDVETFGRHARVAFHDDWEADAARRDFTINALYLSPDGTLYDFFGGRDDLKKGRVCFIGEPGERIREDALRILRFFRFHAHYGKGELDPEGLKACREDMHLIEMLSPERVAAELKRLLAATDPLPTLKVMAESGILAAVLVDPFDLGELERLVRIETAIGTCDVLRRLASLLPDGGEAVARAASALRLSNKEKSRLVSIAERDLAFKTGPNETQLQEALYRSGLQAVEDTLIVNAEPDDTERLKAELKSAREFEIPNFPVTGADLTALGINEGPELGKTLKELEKSWIDSGFELSKDVLLGQIVPE